MIIFYRAVTMLEQSWIADWGFMQLNETLFSPVCVCVYVCVVRSVCTRVSVACTINPSIYNAFIIRQRLSHNLLLHHLVMQLSMFSVYVCVGCWVHVGCWVCVCVWAAGCILQGELYSGSIQLHSSHQE